MLKDVLVYASDTSKEALNVASENAMRNDADVNFICSNLFEKFSYDKFDIIVFNVPNIVLFFESAMIKANKNEYFCKLWRLFRAWIPVV